MKIEQFDGLAAKAWNALVDAGNWCAQANVPGLVVGAGGVTLLWLLGKVW